MLNLLSKIQNVLYEWKYRALKYKWDNFAKSAELRIHVLMYHHVIDDNIEDNPECICKIAVFRDTLMKIVREGGKFISSLAIPEYINSNSVGDYYVITFDDVPSDFYTNAYPILKELNVPFTLFITTDFWEKEGFLSKKECLKLDKDDLCTIGAHTLSHPQLRYSLDIKKELNESKAVLERVLEHKIEVMAYPYGRPSSVSKRVMKEAKNAGFKIAFGTIQSVMTRKIKNMYFIPRIVIN